MERSETIEVTRSRFNEMINFLKQSDEKWSITNDKGVKKLHHGGYTFTIKPQH